jgi:U3 small nucleolar RNA-associated protein 23
LLHNIDVGVANVEIVITQCEIRKLYGQKNEPLGNEAIDLAKTFERRRCGHHPEDFPEPLSTEECLKSVVDPKSTGQNKHRYVVACQEQSVRRTLRTVRGVPQIYVKKSVMLLERMADDSAQARLREEKMKFRAELKSSQLGKRKRATEEDDGNSSSESDDAKDAAPPEEKVKSKKAKGKGPKGPNPLSVKKPKAKRTDLSGLKKVPQKQETERTEEKQDAPAKRKRRRKGKAQQEGPGVVENVVLTSGDGAPVDEK